MAEERYSKNPTYNGKFLKSLDRKFFVDNRINLSISSNIFKN